MNLKPKIIVVHYDFFVHATFVYDPVDESDKFDVFVYMPERVQPSFVPLPKLLKLMSQVSQLKILIFKLLLCSLALQSQSLVKEIYNSFLHLLIKLSIVLLN